MEFDETSKSRAPRGQGGSAPVPPGLHLVSTPIGNARDITLRALDILAGADVLAAEDTRSLRRLLELHGVALGGRRVLAYHDHNGPAVRPKILAHLADGLSVAYASEAGTPLIADPGFVLAREAIEAGHPVSAAPGAVAAVTALTLSGLPSDRFTFAGFAPPAQGSRVRFLKELAGVKGTLLLYESPKRLAAMLADAAEILGRDRKAAVARELTKKFEEVRRGGLGELAAHYEAEAARGEIVVCIGPGSNEINIASLEGELREAINRVGLKSAARELSERHGVSQRELYQFGLGLD